MTMINQARYAGGSAFTCSACMESFATGAEQRQHHKSERHMYNTKRRLANLNPISQQVWEKKMEQLAAASAAQVAKGSAHLKKNKLAKKEEERRSRANSDGTSPTGEEQKPAAPLEPFTPCHCLFDARKFSTVEDNLEYMQKKYNFIIPNKEYLVELEALLKYLAETHCDHARRSRNVSAKQCRSNFATSPTRPPHAPLANGCLQPPPR